MNFSESYGGGLSAEELARASQINASRHRAWRSILLALAVTGIVGIVYIYSQTLVWTGGLLLSGGWLWNSIKNLRTANNELANIETEHLVSLKSPLPTPMKIGLILGTPVLAFLALGALTTYDPSLLETDSTYTSDSNNSYSSSTDTWSTSTDTSTSSDTSSNSLNNSSGSTSEAEAYMDGTFDPTESEAYEWDFTWYSGVNVYIPSTCNTLVVDWETQDEAGNTIQTFGTTYDVTDLGLERSSINRLVYGTNRDVSAEEIWFVPNYVYCE